MMRMALLALFCSFGIVDEVRAQQTAPPAADEVTVVRDLSYVEEGHERQKLDLYLPESTEEAVPLVVWIHGGAWMAGSRRGIGPARRLVESGYAVASIDYRLSQDAIFPAQIEDCKAAIRWLRAHAAEYGIDAERFGVGGDSAGGHLAALVGTTGDSDEFGRAGEHLDESSAVQAVLDWYGPTDFTKMGGRHDGPNSPEARLIGGPVQENVERSAHANPITYVTPDDPPFLIMHGDEDPVVPFNQSELLFDALTAAGVQASFLPIEGAGHGGREFFAEEILTRIQVFFDEHLKRRTAIGGNGNQ